MNLFGGLKTALLDTQASHPGSEEHLIHDALPLAPGDVGPISDLDLIVVLETELSFTQRLAYLYDTLDQKVALDLLPYTQVELDELRESRPFIGQALREGRVLYEA